jgi:hypothetical protein
MPDEPVRQSAVIIPFQARPRGAASDTRLRERGPAPPAAGYPAAPCGSGWYHDAAIRESTPDRKP